MPIENRDSRITVRLTASEKKIFDEIAKIHGLKPAEYVRELCLQAIQAQKSQIQKS